MDGHERTFSRSPARSVSPVGDYDTVNETFRPLSEIRSSAVLEAAGTNTISRENVQAPNAKSEVHDPLSTTIFRNFSSLWIVATYTALALFAWITTCILVHRPIKQEKDILGDPITYDNLTRSAYENNLRWFQAARVSQSIVSLLTIPLASAVCSKAAVTYTQRPRKGLGLTIRQTMVLADKGWSDPNIWWQLVRSPKRHGTTMVWLAIALMALGSTISPLQELFLSRTVITVPSENYGGQYRLINDISDQFIDDGDENNLIPVLTRSMLASTSLTDVQTRLWSRDPTCKSGEDSNQRYSHCRVGEQSTLVNISAYHDPFLAELPFNFSTGVYSRYAPRFNSSTTIEELDPSEFPKSCETIPGAFFAEYTSKNPDPSLPEVMWPPYWKITTCMPANQTKTPWRNTRCRQDFSEDLFVSISLHDPPSPKDKEITYRITLDTTAGYFELPNLANGWQVEPLSISDPISRDGSCDSPSGVGRTFQERQADSWLKFNESFNSSLPLGLVHNKGPLLTIALALFGDGSYLATRMTNPEAYIYPGSFEPEDYMEASECIDLMPFVSLLDDTYQVDTSGQSHASQYSRSCLIRGFREVWLLDEVTNYVRNFIPSYNGIERFANAINAAAFLANEQWLLNGANEEPSLEVKYDPGVVMSKPVMSKSGIIIVSALLGVFLFTCFMLAFYSQWHAHWTNQLDSFAMMRIGAVIADKLPFHIAHDAEKITVLDETPGWVGDGSPDAKVGELQLGAQTRLRQTGPGGRMRLYRCYKGYERESPLLKW